jgi:hypothetical protein
MVKGKNENKDQFPAIVTCPNEVSPNVVDLKEGSPHF